MSDDRIAGLEREVRRLSRKLLRSERHREFLESFKDQSETTLRRILKEQHANQETLEARNAELERATRRLVEANRELREVQESLLDSEQRAQAASRAKSAFLANMSHEVRTPLNSVLGLSGLLARSPLDPRQQELLDTLRDSAGALLEIFDDLLDFSKLELGGLDLKSSAFDPSALVEQVIGMFGERVEGTPVELLCLIAPDTPQRVVADEGRIRQVLLNVVGNAVKFTERGQISLSLKPLERRSGITLLVDDTGPGVDDSRAEDLFAPFVQGDASPTRQHGGLGLGLAISRQIVEALGGRITLSSPPGQGARIRMDLPMEIREVAARRTPLGHGVIALMGSDAAREVVASALEHYAEISWAEGATDLLAKTDGRAVLLDLEAAGLEPAQVEKVMREVRPLVLCAPLDRRRLPVELVGVGDLPIVTHPLRPSRLRDALHRSVSGPERERALPMFSAKVLLCEDNPTNERVARLLLEAMGCAVDVARTGNEALDRWREREYDVVLMDCQMPEMDGFTATQKIREQESAEGRPRTPIVALTASAVHEERQRCLSAGMDDHLAKPVTPEVLEGLMSRWLRPVEVSIASPRVAS